MISHPYHPGLVLVSCARLFGFRFAACGLCLSPCSPCAAVALNDTRCSSSYICTTFIEARSIRYEHDMASRVPFQRGSAGGHNGAMMSANRGRGIRQIAKAPPLVYSTAKRPATQMLRLLQRHRFRAAVWTGIANRTQIAGHEQRKAQWDLVADVSCV